MTSGSRPGAKETLAANERIDRWADVLSASTLIDCADSPGIVPDLFGAPAARRSLEVLSLLDGRIDVPPPPTAVSIDNSIVLMFVETGECVVGLETRRLRLEAGHALFWDGGDPLTLEASSALRRRMLVLPRASVLQLCSDHTAIMGRPITDQTESVGALFEVIDLLQARLPGMRQGVRQTAATLLLKLVGDLNPATIVSHPDRLQLLARILQYIEDNLGAPTLTPSSIARAHAVSLRSLYDLFSDYRSPVSAHIRNRRLSHAYLDVVENADLPLSRIAGRWGFSSAAKFSRLFHERYGRSPSSVRATKRAGIQPD